MAKNKNQQDDGSVIQRSALLAVLNKVRAAVDLRGTTGIEQARHFIINDDRVLAYDDRISISSPLGAKTGLELTANAKDLIAVLDGISEDEITLDLDDDSNLIIVSATSQAGIAALGLGSELGDLIASLGLGGLGAKDWNDLPEGFLDGIKLCAFGASRDVENVAYNSLCVESDRILSTDNWRISRYTFGKTKTKTKMKYLLPLSAAVELIRYNIVQVQQARSWTHFRDDQGLIFSTRTVEVAFPECDKYLTVKGDTVDLPPGLAEAMKAILVFAPGDDPSDREATLQFRKGKVVCRTQNDGGWFEKTVYMPGLKAPDGVPADLIVNPVFLMDILSRTTRMTVGKGVALFSTDNFDHAMTLPPGE